jgi:protein-S-isoprenylcysteine O-methyltransferase Ste14
MTGKPDTARVLIRPPLALFLAIVAGLSLDWPFPLRFLPADLPLRWIGASIFLAGLALLIWSASTIMRAGSNVPTNQPTTAIVERGPYRLSRNPIYIGMFIALVGLAVAFNTLWLMAALAVLIAVIRYGVVAREEAYLERRFGDDYRNYRSSVRRWL